MPKNKKIPWVNTSEPINKENSNWEPTRPRDSVIWFAEMMEAKLKLDDNKPNWEAEDLERMLNGLSDEMEEVIEAFYWHNETDSPRNKAKLIQECIDVANFAMFIASMVDPNKSKNIRGHKPGKDGE